MSAPTKEAISQLYNNTLRASRAFSSYNFREYFVRRTNEKFQALQVCELNLGTGSHVNGNVFEVGDRPGKADIAI